MPIQYNPHIVKSTGVHFYLSANESWRLTGIGMVTILDFFYLNELLHRINLFTRVLGPVYKQVA